MAKYRFYLPVDHLNSEALELKGDEAHHCKDVLRCQAGDEVIVFDGKGSETLAEILSVKRGAISLRGAGDVRQSAELPAALTLGQAIPKGKNMDLIIQKATELGVSRIIPLLTDRTVVQLGTGDLEKKQTKWQRVGIEACKQCGQNWLPQVERPMAIRDFISATSSDQFRIVAAISDEAKPLKTILNERVSENAIGDSPPKSATMMIGPEGDFTPEEVDQAIEAGFAPLSLGPIILRSETAAIYTVSIVGYELMQ